MKSGPIMRLFQMACLLSAVLFFTSSCGTTEGHSPRIGISRFGSENHIRNRVLKHTPLGSTYGQVQEFVQYRLKYHGAPDYENTPADRRRPGGSGYESVGVRSISVWLGQYGFPGYPMAITPRISWAFDKNARLIDVIVVKERDSL
jgi:hypothetical protein